MKAAVSPTLIVPPLLHDGHVPAGFFTLPTVAIHTVWKLPSNRVSRMSLAPGVPTHLFHRLSSYGVGMARRNGRPLFKSRGVPTQMPLLSYWLRYTRCM